MFRRAGALPVEVHIVSPSRPAADPVVVAMDGRIQPARDVAHRDVPSTSGLFDMGAFVAWYADDTLFERASERRGETLRHLDPRVWREVTHRYDQLYGWSIAC